MQTANVMVNIGGDAGNQVPKTVTASEIAVLRAIHGPESVTNIDPIGDDPRGNREELDYLRMTYGRATDGEGRAIVNILFPGAGARVIETIADLGLPDVLFKPTARASAAPVAAPAPEDNPNLQMGEDLRPTEVKKGRKGKAAAEPAPAPKDDASDTGGVQDMADGGDGLFDN